MNKAKVILIGKINSSQDGVIVSTGGGITMPYFWPWEHSENFRDSL